MSDWRRSSLSIGSVLGLAAASIACGSSTPSSEGPPAGASSSSQASVAATSSVGASSTSTSATSSFGEGSSASESSASSSSTKSSSGAPPGGDGGEGDAESGDSGPSSGDASTGADDGGTVDQSTLPPVTIHMAGDSTMSDYTAATTQEGWGQEFGQYFISKVTIDNQAQPGANIQTFYAGKWKTLIANVKAGDYVMAAFGINDSGTTHGPVSVPDFTTEMGVMASEVAAKNATFIPTTSSPLQVWVNGMETNTRLQPYVDATIAFGMMQGLPVDNLNAAGVAYYNMIGQTAAAALTFNGDKAHFDKAGATEMALLASQQLAVAKSPLAAYLVR